MAARLKDEFDRSDRSMLMLINATSRAEAGTDSGADNNNDHVVVNVDRIVCVGTGGNAAVSLITRGEWGTRFEYDIGVRCDGFDITGRAHLSIGLSIGDWLASRENRFLALTNATVTPWRAEPQEFPIVFVARTAIETAWWRDDTPSRG
jgi:hypothetical protein